MINELKVIDSISSYQQGENDVAYSLYLLTDDIKNNDNRRLKLLCEILKNNEDKVTFLKELFFFDEADRKKPLVGNVKKQELLDILLKEESLSNLFDKIAPPYREKVILDIIENTDDNFYQEHKSLLLNNKLPLLLINKDNIRNDYMEKLFEDYSQDLWVQNIFSYIERIDQKYNREIYSNIIKTLDYIYKQPVKFFSAVKDYYGDNENYIISLLTVSANDEDLVEDKQNYTHYILEKLKKENISLNNVLIQSRAIWILDKIDSVILQELLDYSIEKNNIKLVDGIISNYNQENKEGLFLREDLGVKNLNALFATKANFEKEKIKECLTLTDKKTIKKRL